jgi:hypothetical protein
VPLAVTAPDVGHLAAVKERLPSLHHAAALLFDHRVISPERAPDLVLPLDDPLRARDLAIDDRVVHGLVATRRHQPRRDEIANP